MAFDFEPGDPHQQMASVFIAFDNQRNSTHPSDGKWFNLAMANIVGLEVTLAAGGTVDHDVFANFKNRVVAQIRDQDYQFRAFRIDTELAAENPREDWYEACLNRSVLQILLDNYQETGIAGLIDPAQIQEIDELLHEGAPIAAPLAPQLIPPGLPASHWWWTAPAGPPLSIDDYSDL